MMNKRRNGDFSFILYAGHGIYLDGESPLWGLSVSTKDSPTTN